MTAIQFQVLNEWFTREIVRAAALRSDAARLVARARELRQAARTRRGQGSTVNITASGDTVAFRLEGVVAGQPVVAQWTEDGLVVSEELFTRSDLVVRLGEEFAHPDGSIITASLTDGPLRALLTVMRACDVVHFASLDLAGAEAALTETA